MKPGQRSPEAQAYRHLYNAARWKGRHGRRAEQLRAAPLCRMCKRAGRLTIATVADHVVPHRGDEHLFFEGELQSLCKTHHDSAKQGQEARGYTGACDDDGWPSDPRHPSTPAR